MISNQRRLELIEDYKAAVEELQGGAYDGMTFTQNQAKVETYERVIKDLEE